MHDLIYYGLQIFMVDIKNMFPVLQYRENFNVSLCEPRSNKSYSHCPLRISLQYLKSKVLGFFFFYFSTLWNLFYVL